MRTGGPDQHHLDRAELEPEPVETYTRLPQIRLAEGFLVIGRELGVGILQTQLTRRLTGRGLGRVICEIIFGIACGMRAGLGEQGRR
jgi:hypothetical protein